MSSTGLNLQDDPNVNLARLAERIKIQSEKVDTLEVTVYGNGNEGLKAIVAEIQHDLREMDERKDEYAVSQRWKIGLGVGVALTVMIDLLPTLMGLFR